MQSQRGSEVEASYNGGQGHHEKHLYVMQIQTLGYGREVSQLKAPLYWARSWNAEIR